MANSIALVDDDINILRSVAAALEAEEDPAPFVTFGGTW